MAAESTSRGPQARLAELDDLTLRRAANGDAWALETFVRRYERVVLRATTRVLGSENPNIQDIAQETFVKAIPALKTFDTKGSARLSTWLTTIAMRTAIDELRRTRRLEERTEGADENASESAPPDVALDEQRRKAALSLAMQRLDGEQRAILLLSVEEEMSMQEIATALNIEVGTAKSRLSRARDALARAVRTHRDGPLRGSHE